MNLQNIGIVLSVSDKNVSEVTKNLGQNVDKLYDGFTETDKAKRVFEKNVKGAAPIFDQFGNVIKSVDRGTTDLGEGMDKVAENIDKAEKETKEADEAMEDFRTQMEAVSTIRLGNISRGLGEIKDALLGVDFSLFETGIDIERVIENFKAMANLTSQQIGMINTNLTDMGMRWALTHGEVLEKWEDLIYYVGTRTREELDRSLGLMALFGLTAVQIGSFESFAKRVGMTKKQMNSLYFAAVRTQQALQLPPEFVEQSIEMVQNLEEFGTVLHFNVDEYELYSKRIIEMGGKLREAFGKFGTKYMEVIAGVSEKTLGWQEEFRKFAVGVRRDMPIDAIEQLSIGLGGVSRAMRILQERDIKEQMMMLIDYRKAIEGNAIAVDRFTYTIKDMFGPELAQLMANIDPKKNPAFAEFEKIIRNTGEGITTTGDVTAIARKIMKKMPIDVAEMTSKLTDEATSWELVRKHMNAYISGLQGSAAVRHEALEWVKKFTERIKEVTGIDFAGWVMKGSLALKGFGGGVRPMISDVGRFASSIFDIYVATKVFGVGLLPKVGGALTKFSTGIANIGGPLLILLSGIKGVSKGIKEGTKAFEEGGSAWEAAGESTLGFLKGFVSLVPDLIFGSGTYEKKWLPVLTDFWMNIQDWYEKVFIEGPMKIGQKIGDWFEKIFIEGPMKLGQKIRDCFAKTFVEGPLRILKKGWMKLARGVGELYEKVKDFLTKKFREFVSGVDVFFNFTGLKKQWEDVKKWLSGVGDWTKKFFIEPLKEALKFIAKPIETVVKFFEKLFKTQKTKQIEEFYKGVKDKLKMELPEFKLLYSRVEEKYGEERVAGMILEALKVYEKDKGGKTLEEILGVSKGIDKGTEITAERHSPLQVKVKTPEGETSVRFGDELLGDYDALKAGGRESKIFDDYSGILNDILSNIKIQITALREIVSELKQPIIINLDGKKISENVYQRTMKPVVYGGIRG